jgi:hypothetical protein
MDVFTSSEIEQIKSDISWINSEFSLRGYADEPFGLLERYDVDTEAGLELYRSFTDEELLDVIREQQRILGFRPEPCHILDIYLRYIEIRFLTWHWALWQAGIQIPKEDKSVPEKRVTKSIIAAFNWGNYDRHYYYSIVIAREFPHAKTIADERVDCASISGSTVSLGKSIERLKEVMWKYSYSIALKKRDNKYKIGDKAKQLRAIASSVIEIAKTLGRTPLVVEVFNFETFELFVHCGRWSGVLSFCELAPLTGNEYNAAVSAYCAANASVKYLFAEQRAKLTEAQLEALNELCSEAQQAGRAPEASELPRSVNKLLTDCFGSPDKGLKYIIREQPPEGFSPGGNNPDKPVPKNPAFDEPTQEKLASAEPISENPTQVKSTLEKATQLNKDIINTNSRNIESNQLLIPSTYSAEVCEKTDEMESLRIYREIISENIAYDYLLEHHPQDRLDEIVELILETVCSARSRIRVAGDDYPAELVKAKLLKLNELHIEYVLECMDKNTTEIRNIKQYLLTALFNAPSTINSYYTARVNHDNAVHEEV